MKYLRYRKDGENYFGVLEGDTITELNGDFLKGNAEKSSITYGLDEVTVLSPVEPSQVIGIGLNYALHAEETGKPLPEEPMMFMVSPSAVISEGEEIELPTLDHRIDYEAELAVVIGKEAKNVSEEDALSYVFGYTIGNDVSDRHLQKKDGQFTRAKSFATFKPLGPVIETELDPNHTGVKLTLNGEVKQQSNTNDLIHKIEKLLVKVTEVMTLQPGDVILTGTPSGVGALSPGDKVEIEIEGIGKLTNYVKE
ncbi:fumarylacetoacetate hydrolase family protein [Halobacillus karajensis]|uniref:Ureidoglycolate lyase n=1 Tax=Halobacillus karajensis TaxID=195088 RepID=A0A059NY82_9BACI|nr:fumarylacetoacetate hydrolase family protein [Halobacillus karajensis]CDQ18969.1 Ureidoglycolate lyase [Halobacillus karajensis]CDQ22957.1 Ureidoglycolate lyase [Halobacillus karajensis]CDQ26440.1 Ureidoglycolate lyase [Halobacillus karajensis]